MEHRNYDELYSSLSDKQKAEIDSCKSSQELAKTLGKHGVALPDALLETISGGRREITQEDYDSWLQYAYVPWEFYGDRNPYIYYTTWDIPRICDLPTATQRSIAAGIYCDLHGLDVGPINW